MFNSTSLKNPTPLKPVLKRSTLANYSTAVSHHRTNPFKNQTTYDSKLQTTRESLFNPRQSFVNTKSSFDKTQLTQQRPLRREQDRSQIIDTSQITTLISMQIQNDTRLSNVDSRAYFRTHTYQLSFSKVVTQESRLIPSLILQKYQEAKRQKNNQDQPVNFCQGYLQKANIIYYSVQKELFLYNADQFSNSGAQMRHSPKKVNLKQILFRIYEVTLKNTLIQKKIQDKILLFSYPYQIDFCYYENSEKSSQIKLIDLQFAYGLNTQKGQFFQSTDDCKIIYLDNDGKLNYISTEQNKTLGFLGSGKYGLRNHQASRFIRNQFWIKKDGFFDKIRLMFRKATNYTYSLLPFKHQNCNLVYDQKRKMVFSLTSYTQNKSFQIRKRTIKVYTIVEDQFIPIWSISEDQILEDVTSRNLFKSKLATQIWDICKVDMNYNKGSNLLLVLKNSSRVYLDISQQKVLISQIIHGPQFSSLEISNRQKTQSFNKYSSQAIQDNAITNFQKQLKINQKAQTQTKIKGFYYKNSTFIMLALHQKNVYSLFFHKQNRQNQNQKLMNIAWKDKIATQQQIPRQNYIYKISDSFLMGAQIKQLLSNDNKICDSYDYLRQIFYPPQHYYYCNQSFVCKFLLLRPIDILFSVVHNYSHHVCQTFLPKIFNNISIIELCVMLLQIYTNQQGVYYQSSDFNESLSKIFSQQVLFMDTNISRLSYRMSQSQSKMRYSGRNVVNKVEFKQISRQKIGLIQKLFMELSQKSIIAANNQLDYFFSRIKIESNKGDQKNDMWSNSNLTKNQFGSLILYISRIFHPLWNKRIQDIDKKQNDSYIQKIKSLKKINVLFRSSSSQQAILVKIDGFLEKSTQILNLVDSIKNFPPNTTFQECFQHNAKFFEDYIFNAIDKYYDASNYTKFQKLFPMYISKYFKKIIKMYEQIRVMVSHSKIMDYLKDWPCLPRYFIDYLVNIRQIKQALTLRVQGQCRILTAKLSIPGNMTVQAQIDYIFAQVRKAYRPIQQKLYYLEIAENKIQQLAQIFKKKKYSNRLITEKRQTLLQLSNCLKIQKLMKQQYQDMQTKSLKQRTALNWTQDPRRYDNSPSNNDQASIKLQNLTYKRQNIRVLLQKLNSPKLLIIYYSLFGKTSQSGYDLAIQWEKLLLTLNLNRKEETDKNLQNFIKDLKKEIQVILVNTRKKLNIGLMMKHIDAQLYVSSAYMKMLKSKRNGELFSLGYFLADIGCDKNEIAAYYFQIIQQQAVSNQTVKYLYTWFNCLKFILKFALNEINRFVALSQEYIKLNSKKDKKKDAIDSQQITLMNLELKKLKM